MRPMTPYRTHIPVLFKHCDPFGIVFYPRAVEMVSDAIESWFGAALGMNFHDMHLVHGLGVPTASLALDFRRPSQLGEELEFSVTVRELGRSSFKTRVVARVESEDRFEARSTLVFAAAENGAVKPVPIPENVRDAMARFLEPTA